MALPLLGAIAAVVGLETDLAGTEFLGALGALGALATRLAAFLPALACVACLKLRAIDEKFPCIQE
jgi:hypothetical protein